MANDFKRMWTKEELKEFLQIRLDKPSASYNLDFDDNSRCFLIPDELFNKLNIGDLIRVRLSDTADYDFCYAVVNRKATFDTDKELVLSILNGYVNLNVEGVITSLYFQNDTQLNIKRSSATYFDVDGNFTPNTSLEVIANVVFVDIFNN